MKKSESANEINLDGFFGSSNKDVIKYSSLHHTLEEIYNNIEP